MDHFVRCMEKGCASEFILSESDVEYYQSREFDLPKRCPACRRKRREARAAQNAVIARSYNTADAMREGRH